MAEDTDLLPWVLGAMLALGAVAAIAVGLSPPPAQAPAGASANTAPAAAVAAHPASPGDLPPVVVSTNVRPQLPPSQVWECTVDGQRVFSDARCGAHATVRQLSEQNVFDSAAASVRSAPRTYGYGPAFGDEPPPVAAGEAPVDNRDAGDPVYTEVILVHDRAHRDPVHRAGRPHPRAAHP